MKVKEHSHLAFEVNLIDKLDDEVMTPFGELQKSDIDNDSQFLKPKTNKHDKEFLNQIAYLQSLIKLVSNEKCSRDIQYIDARKSFFLVLGRKGKANSFERSRFIENVVRQARYVISRCHRSRQTAHLNHRKVERSC